MYKEILLNAYEETKRVTEKYIKNTVYSEDIKKIRKELKNFKQRKDICNESKQFINIVLDNKSLLNKIKLCRDGSYRNCRLLIKPYHAYLTLNYKQMQNKTMQEKLQFIIDHCETFFIQFSYQSLKEKEKEDYIWDMIM